MDAGTTEKLLIFYGVTKYYDGNEVLGGRDGIPIPKEIEKNNAKLYWQGWDWYQSLFA